LKEFLFFYFKKMRKNLPKLSAAAIHDNAVRRTSYLTQLDNIPHLKHEGYFGRHSASWKLYREPIVLLGGIRALLLQIAHPAIADGVNRYSNFQEDALDRGRRTFMAMAKIYFAEADVARQTAIKLHTIHSYIRGTCVEKNGQVRNYCANDPDLLLWVLATLIDTTFLVFDTISPGKNEEVKTRFYEETRTTALLMGIPSTVYPPTLSEFNTYFQRMLEQELGVDDTSMALAAAILDNRYSSKKLSTALAVGFLPTSLTDAFGLEATPAVNRRFQRLIKRVKMVYSLIPTYLRFAPAWHQAHFRVAKAEGRRAKSLGRFYNWLSKKVAIPLGI
jgi:uncharacterized protein (DUF2236 family)